jgi:hypothetical protein
MIMPLKHKIVKLDDVPEPFRVEYKPAPDGIGFVLDVDGVVEKARLDEFRNNNIQLQQQLDKLKDVDPVKYRELIKIQQQIDEKQLIEAGKVNEVVELRVTAMREELTTKLDEVTGQNSVLNKQLSILLIDNVVKDAAIKNGVVPTAVDDVVLRAATVFRVVDGHPVPQDAAGKVIYGRDGTTPMSVSDWLVGLKKTAPHLFVGSSGSGAGGGDRTSVIDMSKASPIDKINAGLASAGMLTRLPGT